MKKFLVTKVLTFEVEALTKNQAISLVRLNGAPASTIDIDAEEIPHK